MISRKKSHVVKVLHLALALSLLQVDPDAYLYPNSGSWESPLELRHGGGWELEMLRAVPLVEFPYANRKTMLPLIEDLVHFDRQYASNRCNVTAYLLNVQGDQTANQTAAVQELQTVAPAVPSAATASGATALEQAAVNAVNAATAANAANADGTNTGVPDIDTFMNSHHFQDQLSMWEQNLADLRDFGELPPSLNTYAGLPLKDEPFDDAHHDFKIDAYLTGIAADLNRGGGGGGEGEGALALNDSAPHPGDPSCIKVENQDNDTHADTKCDVGAAASGAVASLLAPTCIKEEVFEELKVENEEQDEQEEQEQEVTRPYDVQLNPFISRVELSPEESEIVEVLWKQDVDLGYTLTPPHLTGPSGSSGSGANAKSFQHSENLSYDDVERLKALEELKHDELKFDCKDEQLNEDVLNNEWAGIPFTIDNETGEYIRLPLDDLLNDVLQLADFVDGNEPSSDDSAASTSTAAASKSGNNSIKFTSQGGAEAENKRREQEEEEQQQEQQQEQQEEEEEEEDSRQICGSNNRDAETSHVRPQAEIEVSSLPSPLFDLDDAAKEQLAADLDMMIQSAAPPFHHHAPHRAAPAMQSYAVGGGASSAFHRQTPAFPHGHHQARVPLSRGVSMEQRLQDIASLFNPIPSMGVSEMPPYPHYPSHHYAYQGASGASQHVQYPHPPPPPPPPPHPHHHHSHHSHHAMLHHNAPLGVDISQAHYGHNLGSVVSSSMHLTNASHEGDVGVGASGGASNVGAYKMEHDMMYYSNASSDMNHTTDGFINSILNDEDLHLMDMNVNEGFCRMVDVNNTTSNNSSVLGLSSGHASGGGSSAAGLPMSVPAAGGASGGAPAGMTADMMNAGATGADRLDASSDSAVSSMGSERVPSLSDGEWGEGSDSAQDYHHVKYGGPYDYSYSNNNRLNDGSRQPPVAQKKHQMFGKRILHEQQPGVGAPGGANGAAGEGVAAGTSGLLHAPPPLKYEYEAYPPVPGGLPHVGGGSHPMGAEGLMGPVLSKDMHAYDLKYGAGHVGGTYSLDFSVRPPRTSHDIVHHNHSYTLPQEIGPLPRPQQRDKKSSTSSTKSARSSVSGEEEHLTRDEKRARALNIPIPVPDIINLPMDEFNERLSKYDLTENQLSLIRDIRRRGKNKVAAQNCRKRKLDQILSLEDEVKEVRRRKDHLIRDRDSLAIERKRISNKFAALHRHIFQYLRDAKGNPCSPSEYSLQQAADGSVYLLPRESNKADSAGGATAAATANGSTNHMNLSQHRPHNTAVPQQQQQPQQPQQQQPQQQQQQQQQQHPHTSHVQQSHLHHPHAATHHTTQPHPHHPHQKD